MWLPKQYHADCKTALRREVKQEYLNQFQNGSRDPQTEIDRYKAKNIVSRALSAFFGDEDWLLYQTALSLTD